MTRERLQQHMQAAWDQGNDPFQDERVLTLLEEQPELLEHAARWRQSVAALRDAALHDAALRDAALEPAVERTTTARPGRRPVPARRMLLAAAAALAAVLAWPRADDAPRTPAQENETTSTGSPPPRFLQTTLTRRIEHHGSACSVQQFSVETSAVPEAAPDEPRLPILTRIARTERTSLAR